MLRASGVDGYTCPNNNRVDKIAHRTPSETIETVVIHISEP